VETKGHQTGERRELAFVHQGVPPLTWGFPFYVWPGGLKPKRGLGSTSTAKPKKINPLIPERVQSGAGGEWGEGGVIHGVNVKMYKNFAGGPTGVPQVRPRKKGFYGSYHCKKIRISPTLPPSSTGTGFRMPLTPDNQKASYLPSKDKPSRPWPSGFDELQPPFVIKWGKINLPLFHC